MSTQPLSPSPLRAPAKPSVLNTLRRQAMNHLITGLSILSTVVVIAPLVAILVYLIYKGASSLNFARDVEAVSAVIEYSV